jgi:NAD(P)-dependent dehydrogenase (short-subunit alcohol dehydrogenase family)
VVTVSSSVTMWSKLDLADLDSARYAPMRAYGQSKVANLLFMLELDRRAPGLISAAAHPGATITNLQSYESGRLVKLLGQTADRGALPTLYAAVAGDVRGGSYVGPRDRFGMIGPPVPVRVPRSARDASMARTLWERSEEMTGVRFALRDAARASA